MKRVTHLAANRVVDSIHLTISLCGREPYPHGLYKTTNSTRQITCEMCKNEIKRKSWRWKLIKDNKPTEVE